MLSDVKLYNLTWRASSLRVCQSRA